MGLYTQLSSSSSSADNTALQQRLNGYNQEPTTGTFIASNIGNIFQYVLNIANGDVPFLNRNSKEEESTINVDETTNNLATYNQLVDEFKKTPNQESAKALRKFYLEHDDNKTIKTSFTTIYTNPNYKKLFEA